MLRRKLFHDEQAPSSKAIKLNDNQVSETSKYFTPSYPDQILKIQLNLNQLLAKLNFIEGKIHYVYNPLEYAFDTNEMYIRKYCTSRKQVVFVGMNPGPYGMCQTGVPFGDVSMVRDWLQLSGDVNKPLTECPNRPIQGFQCTRKEQSGHKFWTLLKEICGTPETFFKKCFVYNYCPLAFMKADGGNVTPSEIKGDQKKTLETACDAAFFEIIELLSPEIIVAVGEYSERKANTLLKVCSPPLGNIRIVRLPHPSPRALNNQNWPEKARQFFEENNLLPYLKNE